MVVVEPPAEVLRGDLVGNPALIVVVGRRLSLLDEILVRLRGHVPVQREQRALVGAVGIHEPIARDDVVGERRADQAARARRVRPHRQRIVDLVLAAVRQPEQIGEVAVEVLLVGGDRARRRALRRGVVVVALVVGEEEQLVAAVDQPGNDDRAAERGRDVVLVAAFVDLPGLRALGEGQLLLRIERIDLVGPVLVVRRAAQRVRARARHHRDGAAGAVALRRVEVGRLDAHLLDHVGVGRARDAAAAAGIGGAVDRVVEAADTAEDAARRVGRPVDLSGDHLHLRRRTDHALREAGEQDRHVRRHRQAGDQRLIEVLARRDRGRIEERRLGRDVDALGNRADFQRQFQGQRLAHRQRDAALAQALETRHVDRDPVRPGLQQRRFEVAADIGHQRLRQSGVDIGDRDRRAGNDAGVVLDGTVDVAAGLLGPDRRGRQQCHHQKHRESRSHACSVHCDVRLTCSKVGGH